jgi:hypothetical protein
VAVVWTNADGDRPEPGRLASERQALDDWLDFHRATLLMKCSGLTADQLKTKAAEPSALSLLGLVRHMSEVERWWFRLHAAQEESLPAIYCTEADPNADFDALEGADALADVTAYQAEIEVCRAAVASLGLDDIVPSRGHHPERIRNIRWIYLHMIEEYARHNGHADIIRQRIDGVTGA